MMKKMLILSQWLMGMHLLLGAAVVAALKTSGVEDGLGRSAYLLFGILSLPMMFLLGSLGLVTGSVTINVMILMLACIPQWIIAGALLGVLDELLLHLRVHAENSLVNHPDGHLNMLSQLKKHSQFKM